MDFLSPKMHLITLMAMRLVWVFSHEVTVRTNELKPCKADDRVCVTNDRDCGPRPTSPPQMALNVSCHYEEQHRSVTCEWSQKSDSDTVSLIFSKTRAIDSCKELLDMYAQLTITLRIKTSTVETWCQCFTGFLFKIVKLPPPGLTVLGSTHNSVNVSWRSSDEGSCRLRYRANNTQTWSQAPNIFHVDKDQILVYTIKDLLPFNAYKAAVACRSSEVWSDWSSAVTAWTLERVPSKPPEVCYRVETTNSSGHHRLHLMWKKLDPVDPGGQILGYQVQYRPVEKTEDRLIKNVKSVMTSILVEDGIWNVTIRCFNMAGYGPAAHVLIDTQRKDTLPSVTNLWVSSSLPATKGLMVQWKIPTDLPSAPSISHFTVRWQAQNGVSRWSTVDNSATSTIIQDLDPDKSYLIDVFPIYRQKCGSPRSLQASLQQGALVEVVNLKVTAVTKTMATVTWAWQEKSGPIRVNGYRVTLRRDSQTQTLDLWPDQNQHTFTDLKPNSEYFLLLLADNVSRNIIPVQTDFDIVPVVAAATPLLLLAVTMLIVSILSRTVFRWYFFPDISSPWDSRTGKWLMDPNRQISTKDKILDVKDFEETDVLGQENAIVVGPNAQLCLEKETPLLTLSHLYIGLSGVILDATESHQLPCGPPDTPEESGEAEHLRRQTSVKGFVHKLVANAESNCANQMTCEVEYVVHSTFVGKSDVETLTGQTGCSLICETDYISNNRFTAQTANENV